MYTGADWYNTYGLLPAIIEMDYETVEERLIKFWKDHPDGQIHTKVLEHTSSRFIVEASIYRTEADQRPWTTGLAEETVQGRGVNATSALENCETSAIGRALANAGYATKGKRASREEMNKVATVKKTEAIIDATRATGSLSLNLRLTPGLGRRAKIAGLNS